MTREHNSFQIQLAETPSYTALCYRCGYALEALKDSECVIMWPPTKGATLHFHVDCFGEVLIGMNQFFKTFVTDQGKTKILQ